MVEVIPYSTEVVRTLQTGMRGDMFVALSDVFDGLPCRTLIVTIVECLPGMEQAPPRPAAPVPGLCSVRQASH